MDDENAIQEKVRCPSHNQDKSWNGLNWNCPRCDFETLQVLMEKNDEKNQYTGGWIFGNEIAMPTEPNGYCTKHTEQYLVYNGDDWLCPLCVEEAEAIFLSLMTYAEPLLKKEVVNFLKGVSVQNDLVPKFFEMDPSTDDILFDGSFLREGMRVLIEHPSRREEVADVELSSEALENARRNNRWATVSMLQTSVNEVSFIAEYSDGTKKKRVEKIDLAWYVKKV